MEEQLLHFIWHQQLFSDKALRTTEGDDVVLMHPGFPNADQGPDFLQARVKIAGQLWAGHVEIHIRSSAWFLHGHEHDTHYNNVILHVVWKEDQPAFTKEKWRIPCIELEGRVDHQLLDRYHLLMSNQEWVPCASALSEVKQITRIAWMERMIAERLESKTLHMQQLLERTGYHWEQVFFVLLARQLGAPTNGDTMEELCIKVPWNLMRKHQDRPDQIEAILFGCAGMLDPVFADAYPAGLKKEFDFLQAKYQLTGVPGLRWKFMRMRPVHFPTLRLAQLAVIIQETTHFISLLEKEEDADTWIRRFSISPSAAFWDTHYHFSSSSSFLKKKLGIRMAEMLVINVVAPVTFMYGKWHGKPSMKAHALALLRSLPAEQHAIADGWKDIGWEIDDAADSQGLLHLKKQYCDQRRCMHCAIGLQVLQ